MSSFNNSSSSSCSKSFNICVVLDILDVTCPGVCICPKGMVYLDIRLFGCNSNTSYVEPRFPLTFDEKFSFHENFTEITNLSDVQKSLEQKCVRIALVQVYEKKRITLATYKNNVDDVLYPERNRLSRKGEISVFMKNEPFFPGTISPKITLITKTSVTERIITNDGGGGHRVPCWRHSLKKAQCPPKYTTTTTTTTTAKTKRVHHNKFTNARNARDGNGTLSPVEDVSSNTADSDNVDDHHDGQPLYCSQRTTKADCTAVDRERYPNKTCKYCSDEDVNGLNVTEYGNKSSCQNYMGTPLEPKNKSADENNAITTNKYDDKSVRATFKVEGHCHKCNKSMLNNISSANESMKTSDEDCVVRDQTNVKNTEHRAEEPRKISPKINLHLDVYYCKCGMSDCASRPSWRNICREVNRNDATGDVIKYHTFLRNYYRRLYDSATYQLGRNLKLL